MFVNLEVASGWHGVEDTGTELFGIVRLVAGLHSASLLSLNTMNLPFKTSQQLQAQWQVLRTYLIISFYYWTPIFTFLHTLQKCFRERT
ncbi:unnamed protein product [Musa acuminata subsp. malaccensis]|uniref:(wild Malaysian banana) hypothetical protein n=1 Tax=Musa acuminata subsp. malaccensis TaxID=214687 RepID=A0A804KMF3_MUSAM|nr:unnamed protein product [Musa acuminata subsp. malaccensis]